MSISALLIAAAVGTLISMGWYSQPLFDKTLSKNKSKGIYFLIFLNTFLLAVVLGQFIRAFNTEANFILGMLLGSMVGLGFITPAIATNYLLEGRRMPNLITTVLHHTIVSTIMGGIIVLLSK